VVQLQFPDLMIGKENETVPMDTKARADLIDRMARILVAVAVEVGYRDGERSHSRQVGDGGLEGPIPVAEHHQDDVEGRENGRWRS
jgi:hypothetical protein